ncbi:hypothetical protein DY000_02040810 [Brassica cretica]|uniref:Uncharacterized protein n=1 Tax=Brassica cretica TaxID=69181 RepID=A0ABQ7BL78_BRACR|nr:hypothetical protein DY000_02040810 [Brassica cretica]
MKDPVAWAQHRKPLVHLQIFFLHVVMVGLVAYFFPNCAILALSFYIATKWWLSLASRVRPWLLLPLLPENTFKDQVKYGEVLVCVNEDPPDPMLAGAWYELVELLLDAYDIVPDEFNDFFKDPPDPMGYGESKDLWNTS